MGFFIRIYIRTCDTDGYKYIYIYIFVTSYERQSLQSDRRKLFSSKEGRKSEGRGKSISKTFATIYAFSTLIYELVIEIVLTVESVISAVSSDYISVFRPINSNN